MARKKFDTTERYVLNYLSMDGKPSTWTVRGNLKEARSTAISLILSRSSKRTVTVISLKTGRPVGQVTGSGIDFYWTDDKGDRRSLRLNGNYGVQMW